MPIDAADRRRAGVRAAGGAARGLRRRCSELDARRAAAARRLRRRRCCALLDSPNIASKAWVYRQYDFLVRRQHGRAARAPMPRCCASRGRNKAHRAERRLQQPVLPARSLRRRHDRGRGGGAQRRVRAGPSRSASPTASTSATRRSRRSCGSSREAVRGIRDACVALGLPVVSGNVSFYNETDGKPIPPTPTIAMVGLLEDVEPAHHAVVQGRRATSSCCSGARARSWAAASTWRSSTVRCAARRRGSIWRSSGGCSACAGRDRAKGSCARRTTSREGGLAVALAECCIAVRPAPALGAEIEVEGPIRADACCSARASRASSCRCAAGTWAGCASSPRPPSAADRARRGARPPVA